MHLKFQRTFRIPTAELLFQSMKAFLYWFSLILSDEHTDKAPDEYKLSAYKP